jgi:hypothetical protein
MPQHQTTFEVLLNPSVEEIDEERLAKRVRALFTLFRARDRAKLPVSTIDLMEYGKGQYNARLYELRRGLIPLGWCIDKTRRGENGNHYYKLVPVEQSTFAQKLREKGEI